MTRPVVITLPSTMTHEQCNGNGAFCHEVVHQVGSALKRVAASQEGCALLLHWATITAKLGILGWLIAIAMLFIVPVKRKPSSATALVLLNFIEPYHNAP